MRKNPLRLKKKKKSSSPPPHQQTNTKHITNRVLEKKGDLKINKKKMKTIRKIFPFIAV